MGALSVSDPWMVVAASKPGPPLAFAADVKQLAIGVAKLSWRPCESEQCQIYTHVQTLTSALYMLRNRSDISVETLVWKLFAIV